MKSSRRWFRGADEPHRVVQESMDDVARLSDGDTSSGAHTRADNRIKEWKYEF